MKHLEPEVEITKFLLYNNRSGGSAGLNEKGEEPCEQRDQFEVCATVQEKDIHLRQE